MLNPGPTKTNLRFLGILLLVSLFMLTSFFREYPEAQAHSPKIASSIDPSLQSNTSVLIAFQAPSLLEGGKKEAIVAKHQHFMQWLDTHRIPYSLEHSLAHIFNGLILQIKGADVPYIANYSSIKQVFSLHHSFYPHRGIAIQHLWPEKKENSQPWNGKGIRIGLVDTGINPDHPELKGRVAGGYNFAFPGQPYDDRNLHGTFVAGVIGGAGIDEFQRGIAPEVELMSYVVFRNLRSSSVCIIPALEKAVEDNCKIVALPLGGSVSDPEALEQAFAVLRKANIAVITSAGNYGQPLPGRASIQLPGSSVDVLTVGASDDRRVQKMELRSNQDKTLLLSATLSMPSLPFSSSLSGLRMINAGYGSVSDFKQLFPEKTAPFIALIRRGPLHEPLTFHEKMINARNAGAKAVIFINYQHQEQIQAYLSPEIVDIYWHKEYLPSCMVDYRSFEKLLQNPQNWSAHFKDEIISFPDYDSSCGPGSNTLIKPDLMAPGAHVFSIVNLGYNWISGSSISAGFVAGATACLMQAHPKWTVNQLFSSLVHTANPLINPLSQNPYEFRLQGAGEMQLGKALKTSLHISPLSLNMTYDSLLAPSVIKVSNSSSETVKTDIIPVAVSRIPDEASPLTIQCVPSELNLPPGKSMEVQVKISLDLEKINFHQYEASLYIHDLHLPILVKVPNKQKTYSPIQHLKVSPSQWNIQEMKNTGRIEVAFSLISGQRYTSRSLDIILNHALVDISITDQWGLHWGYLYSAYLYPDYYHFSFDPSFVDRLTLPPDGSYYLTIHLWKFEEGYRQVAYQEHIPIEITQSPEKAVDVLWQSYRKQKVGERFTVCLIATQDISIQSFITEFNFDPDLLSCQSIEILSLRGLKGCQPVLTRIGSNIHGIIFVEWSCPDNEIIVIPKGTPLLELGFVGLSQGKADITIRKLYGTDSEGYFQTYRFSGYHCMLYDKHFFHGDINEDGIVDELDLQMLQDSFGASYTEEKYLYAADINGDGLVNATDLSILARDFSLSN